MDGDWEEVGHLLPPPPGAQAVLSSAYAFDSLQELLWVGNHYGRVSSFYGTEFQQYAAFKGGEGPIRQFLFHDKGVIILGAMSIHMAMRRGPVIWHISNDNMKDLQCMTYTSKGTSEVLAAGLQDQMFIINVDKGTITRQVPTSDHYTKMKTPPRYICAATKTGSINLLDPITFAIVKTWKAHSAGINDMDARHDFVVTCGYSMRPQQYQVPDALVNVFDLKNLVPLPPIPFPAGASFVRLHPRMSTTSIVASLLGQVQVVDLMNVNTSNLKQLNLVDFLSMIEIASSGEAMIMADVRSNVQLWGSPSRVRFAEFNNPTEFAEPDEACPEMNWNKETPLSSVGMPYYREDLLSIWPSHMIFEVGAPPAKINPQLLATMTPIDGSHVQGGVYGTTPRLTRRNQVENTRTAEKFMPSLTPPKFLSERARETVYESYLDKNTDGAADLIGDVALSALKGGVPARYCNVEIKYSKYGVDDFDFGHYNRTTYSGLETHISNSYANPLLQLLRFTPEVRNLALRHAASSCIHDQCMLCEMGFLFDMLEKAEGSICKASNLLKSLGTQPNPLKLKILEEYAPGASLTKMLQDFNKFLTNQMVQDWKRIAPHQPMAEWALLTMGTTGYRCLNCRYESSQPGTTNPVTDLLYPVTKLNVRNARHPRVSFSQVLKHSVEQEKTSRAYCRNCKIHPFIATRKTIHTVPNVLMLNANIDNPEAREFWSVPGCLPQEIGVITDQQGNFFCYEDEDLKLHLERGRHDIAVYSLIGLAANIDSGHHQKPHLVSLVNVAHSSPVASPQSQWYLFNDFLVQPVTASEALSFNTSWKTPSVITYQIKRANNVMDNTWKQQLDTSLLYMDHRSDGERTYRPLVPSSEAPGEGTIIALDTEFVKAKDHEIAVNSEGEREIIRPIVHALARVSVIRTSGQDELEPFIDDYIVVREPIIDYNTEFSGIRAEDLNPKTSSHNLVSLKVAYKKLWILLNLGCKFLGHGLGTDFRVINIHIPKSQVIDTATLFQDRTRSQRKIALAFLVWCLLNEHVQQGTHDSIEDARSALKLYRKYLEYQDAGIMEAMFSEIYSKGKVHNWKVPGASRKDLIEGILRPETPPIKDGDSGMNTMPPSGPTTPIRRPATGFVPGTGSTFNTGWTPGRSRT